MKLPSALSIDLTFASIWSIFMSKNISIDFKKTNQGYLAALIKKIQKKCVKVFDTFAPSNNL